MRKFPLIICSLGILLLAGCNSGRTFLAPIDPDPNTHIVYKGSQVVPKLAVGFAIYGSPIELRDVYPGWSGTVPLTIVNGKDDERTFRFKIEVATTPGTGYETFPEECFYWITIPQELFTLQRGESKQVFIPVAMPKDSDYRGKKAEVWIRLDDITQTGLVRIATESTWHIHTTK